MLTNLPAMKETLVRFLGGEDPLEKGKATHSSILGLHLWLSWWRICLQCRRPWFDSWIRKIPWRRKKLPTPAFWPGEYSTWDHKESDTTERLSLSTYSAHTGFSQPSYDCHPSATSAILQLHWCHAHCFHSYYILLVLVECQLALRPSKLKKGRSGGQAGYLVVTHFLC